MRIEWALIYFLEISSVMSWRFKKYPYADMTIDQKAAHDGYPLESYTITTEDSYILTIYRIPHGRESVNTTNRSTVLLTHGLGGSPDLFLILGRGRALAYNLADAGFDVWMMNARGMPKSQGHKYFDLDKDKRYFQYSFHEMAIYDLSANIDFILKQTGQKPFVIGHSQGNTCIYILLADKPEYNEKIKLAVAYGPSLKIYLDDVLMTLLVYMTDILKSIYDLFDMNELIPPFPGRFRILRNVCREQTYGLELCFHILSVVGSNPSRILEKDLVPVIAAAVKARISSTQMLHYMQIIKTGEFCKLSFGPKENMRIYKNVTPPAYDLSKITAPMAIYYAQKDDFATVKGAEDTIKALPNVVHHHKVEYEYFTHTDFIFGKNASALVYQRTIKLFQDFDNQSDTNIV